MDSTNLDTFLAVTEYGSFTEAAEKLYLTQPAVSKRIATLEQEFKTRLFDRVGKQVLLTEAGRVLSRRAHSILAEIEDSRREIHNLSGQAAGRLSIGTSHHIGLHRLPKILRQYTRCFPEVDLDLQFRNSEQICDEVKNGKLELGIITLPPQAMEPLTMQSVWEDELVFAVGRTHPLATLVKNAESKAVASIKQTTIKLQELARYPAILPSRGTYTREIVERPFTKHKLVITTKMETNYLETIKMLISVGLGWTALPSTMVDDEIVVLNISDKPLHRTLGVVRHSARTLSNSARELIMLLQENSSDPDIS